MSEITLLKSIDNETELEEVMTRPRPELVEFIRQVSSPLVILGGSGKMGPTLARLAVRAAKAANHPLRVIAVSRYSNNVVKTMLEENQIETISADLLDPASYASLPDSENIIYLVGLKFGTTDRPDLTWATNTIGPLFTCQRYADSRIAALSSGNVYSLTSVKGRGSMESDPLTPIGEYSNSTVGRERIFEYYSLMNNTQIAQARLYYALDLRYGVLCDIAQKIWAGTPVDVTNGYLNCIWQGDANEFAIRSLGKTSSPPFTFNLTSSHWYSIRELASQFSVLMNKRVVISGEESDTAFLGNTNLMVENFGEPPTPLETVMRWTANWVMTGKPTWNKPTHFETRDGGY